MVHSVVTSHDEFKIIEDETKESKSLLDNENEKVLRKWLSALYQQANPAFKLIYKATQHGFSGKDFHRHCESKGPTVSLIKSEYGNVFGAFTCQPWTSPDSA